MTPSEDSYSMNSIPVTLGNPTYSRELRKRKEGGELVEGRVHFEPPGCCGLARRGMTTFWYKRDQGRYETGHFILVFYDWNKRRAKCFENDLLRRRERVDIETFRDKILGKIENLVQSIIMISIRTVKGSLEVRELPREDLGFATYPPLTVSFSAIPHVAISGLQICPVGTEFDHIDIVTKIDDLGPCKPWYVFKRYTIPLEDEEKPFKILLNEAKLLCQMDSPYIMKPSFIVTDNANTVFYGYLMPFMSAGSLGFVFEELARRSLQCEPMFLHPKHLELRGCNFKDEEAEKFVEFTGAKVGKKLTNPQLPWSIKHTWAIEATSALFTLHGNSIFSGDVKLHNILLDREGHLQLIDVAPQPDYTYYYVAPEIDICCEDEDYEFPLTEARDIFAFGLVLWQIAEEEATVVERKDLTLPPYIVWRPYKVPGSTPRWYRDLVRQCLNITPEKRPSAKDILDVLNSKR